MPNKPTNQRIISPKFYRLIKKNGTKKDDELIVFFHFPWRITQYTE